MSGFETVGGLFPFWLTFAIVKVLIASPRFFIYFERNGFKTSSLVMSVTGRTTWVFLFAISSIVSFGQNQLVLFNRERILARYSNGDDFVYKRKKAKHYTRSFVTDLKEFSVVTFNDTVPFSEIDRVSLKGFPHKRFSLLSKVLITGGLLYFALDQVNNIIVQGNKPDMNPSVWRPSLVLVSVGYLLKTVHKTSQKIRYPARLVTVPRGSRFYQSDQ